MILDYEIPQGSNIYFSSSARLKRDIECLAVNVFYENGFDEIATPLFSFVNDEVKSNAIRMSADNNKQMILRNDNTIDVIKIINHHLGDNISKKWFYIQSAFSYPSNEISQIGAEYLDEHSSSSMICIAVDIFSKLALNPILQISNMNIPRLCAKESGLDIDIFANMRIDKILQVESYFTPLLEIQTKSDLESYIPKAPRFLKDELKTLLECASYCYYENTLFSPLYYSSIGYYDNLFFRMFIDNKIFLLGGKYEIDKIHSCGFAIYTNEVVEYILNKGLK